MTRSSSSAAAATTANEEFSGSLESFLQTRGSDIVEQLERILPRTATAATLEKLTGPSQYPWDATAFTSSVCVPVWDLLDRGGKRLRPVITCLVCEAVGGRWNDAISVAALVEMIHNGTLMHDDIEDDSACRRGKPCTHKVFGVDRAINAGMAMFFCPLLSVIALAPLPAVGCRTPDELRLALYLIYATEMMRVCSGQAIDIEWHARSSLPSEEHYLQMCLAKTGVLIRMGCMMGALFGGAADSVVEAVGAFGQHIGVAFQIQDDILELTEERFKANKGDIHEGKRSLIVIRTFHVASDADRSRLLAILDAHTTDEGEITEAIDIIHAYDGIAYARAIADRLVGDAWRGIDDLLPESSAKDMLHRLAAYCLSRKK